MTAFPDSFHPKLIVGNEVVIQLFNFKVGSWIFLSKVLQDSSEMTPIIPAQSTPPIR
jgi:hypothetical protein